MMDMPTIPQPTYYIFKCEQSAPPGMPKPSCVSQQTNQLFGHLTQVLMQKGLMGAVQPIRTSCLGRCQQGPVMLVVGQNSRTMYVELTPEKITRIIEEHIIAGNVVEEYVIPEQFWGEPADLSSQ